MSVENDKILIVEDNVIWGENYKKWISGQYQIKLAFNKTDALEFCDLFEPDIIILDLGLQSHPTLGGQYQIDLTFLY